MTVQLTEQLTRRLKVQNMGQRMGQLMVTDSIMSGATCIADGKYYSAVDQPTDGVANGAHEGIAG